LISNHFGDSVSGPEKAGVGGSIPSLATIVFNNLTIVKTCEKVTSREQYANISFWNSLARWFHSPCVSLLDHFARRTGQFSARTTVIPRWVGLGAAPPTDLKFVGSNPVWVRIPPPA